MKRRTLLKSEILAGAGIGLETPIFAQNKPEIVNEPIKLKGNINQSFCM